MEIFDVKSGRIGRGTLDHIGPPDPKAWQVSIVLGTKSINTQPRRKRSLSFDFENAGQKRLPLRA